MAGSNNHTREGAGQNGDTGASGQIGIERDHNYDYGGLWPSESHTVDDVDPNIEVGLMLCLCCGPMVWFPAVLA